MDGQGNFGSVDGDNAAAMRYTEIRMARIAHELLADIEKKPSILAPTTTAPEHEPLILPAKIPNLLINGSSGHCRGHGHQYSAAQPQRGGGFAWRCWATAR